MADLINACLKDGCATMTTLWSLVRTWLIAAAKRSSLKEKGIKGKGGVFKLTHWPADGIRR